MTSFRQMTANRRNALKSTGPITAEGKERSRGNALRHGLTAETVIATIEDEDDYRAFEAAVIADYDAETAVQRELALRLASILWRLRRAIGIESALFESVTTEPDGLESEAIDRKPSKPDLVIVSSDKADKDQSHAESEQHSDASARRSSPCTKANAAEGFLRLAALQTFPLDRLSRYELSLWRQARQIVFAIESMRPRSHSPARSRFPFVYRSGQR